MYNGGNYHGLCYMCINHDLCTNQKSILTTGTGTFNPLFSTSEQFTP